VQVITYLAALLEW
jgi:hypothetical protein